MHCQVSDLNYPEAVSRLSRFLVRWSLKHQEGAHAEQGAKIINVITAPPVTASLAVACALQVDLPQVLARARGSGIEYAGRMRFMDTFASSIVRSSAATAAGATKTGAAAKSAGDAVSTAIHEHDLVRDVGDASEDWQCTSCFGHAVGARPATGGYAPRASSRTRTLDSAVNAWSPGSSRSPSFGHDRRLWSPRLVIPTFNWSPVHASTHPPSTSTSSLSATRKIERTGTATCACWFAYPQTTSTPTAASAARSTSAAPAPLVCDLVAPSFRSSSTLGHKPARIYFGGGYAELRRPSR
eukprot:c15043_g1_i1.p1 GENE.c15043_g1_i1~~c15043_g1_i1.p1  ORF type:complete len:298 (+),score=7.84 c15043_g1_i1:550-1443(+)